MKINIWTLLVVAVMAFFVFNWFSSREKIKAPAPPIVDWREPGKSQGAQGSSSAPTEPARVAPAAPRAPAVALSPIQDFAAFNVYQDISRLEQKKREAYRAGSKIDANAIDEGIISYAQCRTFIDRSGRACGLLSHLSKVGWGDPNRNQLECSQFFQWGIIWKDLDANRPPAAGLGAPALPAQLGALWRKRDPQICESLASSVDPEKLKGCSDNFKKWPDPEAPPDLLLKRGVVLRHLWNKTKPNCHTSNRLQNAFSASLTEGACVGMFEPGACDQFLDPMKRLFRGD